MTKKELLLRFNDLINPLTDSVIDIDKVISNLEVEEDKVTIELKDQANEENNKVLHRAVVKFLKIDLGFKFVKISFNKTEEVKEVPETMTDIKAKFIALMSGKGGVGKSKVTTLLAKSLVSKGYKVGIIDCDIYGYSIPKILNLYGEPDVVAGRIQPLKSKEGIEVISTQYFIPENKNEAVIWRASLLDSMMNHFFNDVAFSEDIDYILIDLPPGTGDIMLNLSKYVRNLDAYLVTTPHFDAAHVAIRTAKMAKDININVLGIIENMSYYDHSGEKLYIFGTEGAKEISNELNVDVVAKLEITNDDNKLIQEINKI